MSRSTRGIINGRTEGWRLVRIRDIITRTISPTAAAVLARYLLRCAARGSEQYLRRIRNSTCYNLVAKTITRKRLAPRNKDARCYYKLSARSRARRKKKHRRYDVYNAAVHGLLMVFVQDNFYCGVCISKRIVTRNGKASVREDIARLYNEFLY